MSVHPRECKFVIFYNLRIAPPRFNPAKVKRAARGFHDCANERNVRALVINWMSCCIYLRRGSSGVTTESPLDYRDGDSFACVRTLRARTLRSAETRAADPDESGNSNGSEIRTMGKFPRENTLQCDGIGGRKKNHSNPLANGIENSRASCTRRDRLYRELFAACISRIRVIDGYYQFQLFVRNR